jgi:hypothetical protein
VPKRANELLFFVFKKKNIFEKKNSQFGENREEELLVWN